MRRFLNGEMPAKRFCTFYTKVWREYVSEALSQRALWPEPYDQRLLAQLQSGEIDNEEFGRQWAVLWGYAGREEYVNAINALHSACDCYCEIPISEVEIDEAQLRREVQEVWEKYKDMKT